MTVTVLWQLFSSAWSTTSLASLWVIFLNMCITGTSTCDLLEVGNESSLLVFGHRADIHGLAMNPKLPHMFATVCESQNVAIWNAESRKVFPDVSGCCTFEF